jgi:hypothetical protein
MGSQKVRVGTEPSGKVALVNQIQVASTFSLSCTLQHKSKAALHRKLLPSGNSQEMASISTSERDDAGTLPDWGNSGAEHRPPTAMCVGRRNRYASGRVT